MKYKKIQQLYAKMEKTGDIVDYTPISKPVLIVLMCREIYTNFANKFLTLECMAEFYEIPKADLKRLLKIGRHSMKNQEYMLKYYKKYTWGY